MYAIHLHYANHIRCAFPCIRIMHFTSHQLALTPHNVSAKQYERFSNRYATFLYIAHWIRCERRCRRSGARLRPVSSCKVQYRVNKWHIVNVHSIQIVHINPLWLCSPNVSPISFVDTQWMCNVCATHTRACIDNGSNNGDLMRDVYCDIDIAQFPRSALPPKIMYWITRNIMQHESAMASVNRCVCGPLQTCKWTPRAVSVLYVRFT